MLKTQLQTRSPSCHMLYQHTEQQIVKKRIHKMQAAQRKRKECAKTLLKLVFEGNRLGPVKTATILPQQRHLPLSTYHSYKGNPSTVLLLYSLYSTFDIHWTLHLVVYT